MAVTVRPATVDDLNEVHEMIGQLFRSTDRPYLPAPRDQFKKDSGLLPGQPHRFFEIIVAQDSSGQLVGYAIYFFMYKTNSGKYLFVEDIFVKSDVRRSGAGLQMMAHMARVAKESESEGMKLHVLEWNEARKFYEFCGGLWKGTRINEWLEYDFDRMAIKMLSRL